MALHPGSKPGQKEHLWFRYYIELILIQHEFGLTYLQGLHLGSKSNQKEYW